MCRPYSVLLPVGFAMPFLLPGPRCAFTAPFHRDVAEAVAVCSLWHFPWGRPRRALPGTVVSVEPGLSSPPFLQTGPRPPDPLTRPA